MNIYIEDREITAANGVRVKAYLVVDESGKALNMMRPTRSLAVMDAQQIESEYSDVTLVKGGRPQ